MEKKTLVIILWIIIILLIWWGTWRYIKNNWTKTEYFWRWEQKEMRIFNLKNWEKEWIEYTYNNNWILIREEKYENGELQTATWYFENWKIWRTIKRYNDGIEDTIEYNEDWSIKTQSLRNGYSIERYENWNLKWEWMHKNYRRDWNRIYYNIDWEELWRCYYIEGQEWEWDCPDRSDYTNWERHLISTKKYLRWKIIE